MLPCAEWWFGQAPPFACGAHGGRFWWPLRDHGTTEIGALQWMPTGMTLYPRRCHHRIIKTEKSATGKKSEYPMNPCCLATVYLPSSSNRCFHSSHGSHQASLCLLFPTLTQYSPATPACISLGFHDKRVTICPTGASPIKVPIRLNKRHRLETPPGA